MGTFSFDFYKTVTTGEGGMVVSNDRDLYVRASEYADHGHDHNPNVGRALEGRSFLGFNYRMNEMQGALGLAQLGKLEAMIKRQQENQALIRELLESVEGITMRALPEKGKDSYTHICFCLPDGDKAAQFHKNITDKGVPAIYFKNNLWHYLPNWEHVIGKKTVWPGPHPFGGPLYAREAEYSRGMLPQTSAIIERLVVMPVFLQTDEETVRRIVMDLQGAVEEVLG